MLRDRRSGRYPKPGYLVGRGHAGDDLVNVVALLVASLGQDVLALGVLGLGQSAGYPPKMLQEIMGHASITTTLDLYGHLYPGEMDRYADRLGSAADDAAAAEDIGKAEIRPDDGEDENGEE